VIDRLALREALLYIESHLARTAQVERETSEALIKLYSNRAKEQHQPRAPNQSLIAYAVQTPQPTSAQNIVKK
jgi:hypothetical protein